MPVRQQDASCGRQSEMRLVRKANAVAIQSGRRRAMALVRGRLPFLWRCGAARAEDASSWREIETKYIFGFTTGSGIGLEGEKEFTIDTIGRFGKRDGHYAATETKYEFEFTPSPVHPDRIRRARIDPQYRRRDRSRRPQPGRASPAALRNSAISRSSAPRTIRCRSRSRSSRRCG